MKKIITTIFFVLSILYVALVVFVGAFCIYDLKTLSSGVYAGSFDMWDALSLYPKWLLTGAFLGLFSNVIHIILSDNNDKKVFKAIVFIFFVLTTIAAFVLRYFCYRNF